MNTLDRLNVIENYKSGDKLYLLNGNVCVMKPGEINFLGRMIMHFNGQFNRKEIVEKINTVTLNVLNIVDLKELNDEELIQLKNRVFVVQYNIGLFNNEYRQNRLISKIFDLVRININAEMVLYGLVQASVATKINEILTLQKNREEESERLRSTLSELNSPTTLSPVELPTTEELPPNETVVAKSPEEQEFDNFVNLLCFDLEEREPTPVTFKDHLITAVHGYIKEKNLVLDDAGIAKLKKAVKVIIDKRRTPKISQEESLETPVSMSSEQSSTTSSLGSQASNFLRGGFNKLASLFAKKEEVVSLPPEGIVACHKRHTLGTLPVEPNYDQPSAPKKEGRFNYFKKNNSIVVHSTPLIKLKDLEFSPESQAINCGRIG